MIHDHVMLDGSLLDAAMEETFDQIGDRVGQYSKRAFVVDAEEDSPSNEQYGGGGFVEDLQARRPCSLTSRLLSLSLNTKARRNFNLWLKLTSLKR